MLAGVIKEVIRGSTPLATDPVGGATGAQPTVGQVVRTGVTTGVVRGWDVVLLAGRTGPTGWVAQETVFDDFGAGEALVFDQVEATVTKQTGHVEASG